MACEYDQYLKKVNNAKVFDIKGMKSHLNRSQCWSLPGPTADPCQVPSAYCDPCQVPSA